MFRNKFFKLKLNKKQFFKKPAAKIKLKNKQTKNICRRNFYTVFWLSQNHRIIE